MSDNPYLNEFNRDYPAIKYYGRMKLGFMDTVNGWMRHSELRIQWTRKYAWAIPNPAAISALKKLEPLIEIGAGTGYWGKMVDGDIVCYDSEPYSNDWCDGKWMSVEMGSWEKILEHPNRTLFLCWPPYESDLVTKCLNVYRGERIVYIGEIDGCTAWDDRLGEIEETIEIPQYVGIHDRMYIFRRISDETHHGTI